MRRIAIFTGVDIRTFGGGERYAIEMSRILPEYEFTYFSYRSKEIHRISDAEAKRLTNSRLVYYDALELRPIGERIPLTTSAFRAFSMLKNFDVIYDYDPSLVTLIMLRLASIRYKKKMIFGMHDPFPLRDSPITGSASRRFLIKIYKPVRNFVIRRIPNVRIVNSEEKRNLSKIGYKGKVYFITDFVRDIGKRALEANRKEFIVLFVGGLTIGHKGADLLAEIIAKTIRKNKNIHFRIAGSGSDGAALLERTAKKYPRNVKLLGFVSEKELSSQFEAASLFISTSRFESFGLSLAEAQAFGLRAVTFGVKGIRDVMQDKRQGELIKPFDTDAFSNAIILYYKNWKSGKAYLKAKRELSESIYKRYGPKVIAAKLRVMFTE